MAAITEPPAAGPVFEDDTIDYSKDEFKTPLMCFDDLMTGPQIVEFISAMIKIGVHTHGLSGIETKKLTINGIQVHNKKGNKCRLIFRRLK